MPSSGIKGALFCHSPSKPYLEVKVHSKQLKTKFKAWGENMRPAKSCAPHFWTIQDDEDRQEKSSTPHFSSIEKSVPHFANSTGEEHHLPWAHLLCHHKSERENLQNQWCETAMLPIFQLSTLKFGLCMRLDNKTPKYMDHKGVLSASCNNQAFTSVPSVYINVAWNDP